ncbi:LysM peptidoglycan-binding domain-containing protein [Deinococcus multiflagellatus]|uniref:LysM peptidoglycan-binding domain-containing protein n=1 Tax=Deinococcus multiflagellatus TaxID=1656887 RepID=A0ABW1ZSA0_9DEIO
MSSLAARHGTTVTALLQINPSVRANQLRVGQKLTLPTRPASTPGVTVRAASVRVSAVPPVQGRLTTPFNAQHGGWTWPPPPVRPSARPWPAPSRARSLMRATGGAGPSCWSMRAA